MQVQLVNIAKRFQYRFIIENCNLTLDAGKCYGLKGANGSGKSTLLKIIAGYLSPSNGELHYRIGKESISRDDVYKYLSFAAPYTDLVDEMNLGELLAFYQKHKKMYSEYDHHSFSDVMAKEYEEDMFLSEYSSGMYQRVRLCLACLSDVPLLLLDEPTSYLDKEAKAWYFDLMKKYRKDKTILICSNDLEDFLDCDEVFDIQQWT